MGMVIFEESGTFNPADWGLQVGDMLQVICVGGGAGGTVTAIDYNSEFHANKGKAGGASSFGPHISADGANTDTSAPNGMGKGGAGWFGTKPTTSESSSNVYYIWLAGGGAGGFLPGAPVWGGDGGRGAAYNFGATSGVPVNSHAPSGLGGKGEWSAATSYQYESFVDLPWANLKAWASGNKGATSASSAAAAGNGYGAGGAGGGWGIESRNPGAPDTTPDGGNSGELKIGSVKLTSTAGIAVTVGAGGNGGTLTYTANSHDTTSTTATAGKGAPGVVIVTW